MKTQINTKYKLDAEWKIYILPKYLSTKYLLITKKKKKMCNFTLEKPGQHLLNEVIKMNIINNKTNRHVSAQAEAGKGPQHHSCNELSKDVSSESNHGNTADKQK